MSEKAKFIEELIENAYSPERGSKQYPGGRKNPDNFYHFRKWGFTVYRTCQDKDFDDAWQMLIHSLRHQTRLAFGGFEQEGVDQDDVQRLKDLLEIDVREDPLLEGLDAQGVRDSWHAEDLKERQAVVQIPGKRYRFTSRPDKTRGMADCILDFVLLADKATLEDVASGEFVVKAVSLQWTEGGHWPGGWMRIPTGYLLDLWAILSFWAYRTEIALRFHGSEEELHSCIWAGDDDLEGTGEYSEIRRFPHYDSQRRFQQLNRRQYSPIEPRDQEGCFKRLRLRRSPDSSPIFYHSSDEDDGPLRCGLGSAARKREENASADVKATN